MFTSRGSKIAVGATLAVALAFGGVGIGLAANASSATYPAASLSPSHATDPVVHATITTVTPAHTAAPTPPAPTPVPTPPGPQPTPPDLPVPFTAHDVWSLAHVAYDPTLVLNKSYVPAPGTNADTILSAHGFAKEYTSTDGNQIQLAVANGAPGRFLGIEGSIATHSTRVAGYGPWDQVQVYQAYGEGTYPGEYDVFVGGYWISVSSNLFTSPAQASTLIHAVLQTIPQG